MKMVVYYETTASFPIEVDVPDDTAAEDIEAVAYDLADTIRDEHGPTGSLCHHCAVKIDIGDFEPTSVEDA